MGATKKQEHLISLTDAVLSSNISEVSDNYHKFIQFIVENYDCASETDLEAVYEQVHRITVSAGDGIKHAKVGPPKFLENVESVWKDIFTCE